MVEEFDPLSLQELDDAEYVLDDGGEKALTCIVQKVLLSPKQLLLSERHSLFRLNVLSRIMYVM